ncbi:cytidine deaminase family protein [Methylomonas methanica]|uniref:CMP/dCMP deaminase zinc-binding protein n=1 Tax=Methylomonas methanica (strain DSM 25384 / MC09) TaxID=857087 RepID=F9ZXU5_METMM|nr:cytidine deaminase [Methylomonas methanica]AEF98524.1 CMP/dCMP deaminase zinc-binding protein [Methylomonas methanica MC09]
MRNDIYCSDLLEELKEQAIKASTFARVIPGSIAIGAAVLAKNNKIYKGCYYPGSTGYTTVHAEHAALINAVSNGATEILRLAIFANTETLKEPPIPCGSCLQAITDVVTNGNFEILSSCISSYPHWIVYSISDLLPIPWRHPNKINLFEDHSETK